MAKNNKYSDISKTGPNLVDLDSVRDAIRNIIYTRKGERGFLRDFGSRIEDYLFSPFSYSMSRAILSELVSSISKWEKRVDVTATTSVTPNFDSRKYEVSVYIKVVGLDSEINIYNTELSPKG
ncbi:hypothetical protein YerA41_178c [Yersinia phage YerA41]|uniref:Baseplate wedge subunit n=1 Tax=Yersinia phage vB_Yru_GN1 TaxID=3074381 RepID=A0AA86IYU9_9CAUD|nr:hypothetical protein YerA41_178c [Yersinia phage YerA41]BES79821.1 putative baseplate wedge subunit [Yersinia phage vB_Yru_GN1]